MLVDHTCTMPLGRSSCLNTIVKSKILELKKTNDGNCSVITYLTVISPLLSFLFVFILVLFKKNKYLLHFYLKILKKKALSTTQVHSGTFCLILSASHWHLLRSNKLFLTNENMLNSKHKIKSKYIALGIKVPAILSQNSTNR